MRALMTVKQRNVNLHLEPIATKQSARWETKVYLNLNLKILLTEFNGCTKENHENVRNEVGSQGCKENGGSDKVIALYYCSNNLCNQKEEGMSYGIHTFLFLLQKIFYKKTWLFNLFF